MKLDTLTQQCPHCTKKYRDVLTETGIWWLSKNPAQNPISRRDGQKICKACARAEAIADHTGIDDSMARVAVESDRQEAMRLPKGMVWGPTQWPTGGFDEWVEEYDRRYGSE